MAKLILREICIRFSPILCRPSYSHIFSEVVDRNALLSNHEENVKYESLLLVKFYYVTIGAGVKKKQNVYPLLLIYYNRKVNIQSKCRNIQSECGKKKEWEFYNNQTTKSR